MYGSIWFVTSDGYFFRIKIAAISPLNILGQIHNNHPRFSCLGNIESLFDCFCQILSPSHRYSIFAYTSRNTNNINFLKSIISDKMRWYLPREAYQWNAIIVCCSNPCNKIGCPRSACHKADANLSCGTGITIRRMN